MASSQDGIGEGWVSGEMIKHLKKFSSAPVAKQKFLITSAASVKALWELVTRAMSSMYPLTKRTSGILDK